MMSLNHPARRAVLNATLAVGLLSASHAMAANGTWIDAPVDSTWATAGNWVGGVVPGATAPSGNNVTNNDIVTFNTAIPLSGIGGSGNPIQWEDTRFIKSIIFDTNAGPYYLGSTSNTNRLYLWNAGSITMNAGATSAQTINGTIQVRQLSSNNGVYSFVNNSTTSSATLNFGATAFTLTNANGRPTTLTLDGTNVGDNTISSNITDAAAIQGVALITKAGTGRWVLSGSNTFTGTANTGIQINAGTLVAASNNALGTASNATNNATFINSGGTLELASGVNLNSGITVNLNNGGTLLSKGANNAISSTLRVSTAVGSTANVQTSAISDVLTIGDAANDFTGGAADSTVVFGGPGGIALSQASNYAGGVQIDAGRLALGNTTAIGSATSANVKFGASSTGVLQLSNTSTTIIGLQGTATGSAVESSSGANTLTINNTAANQYGGVIRDGGGQLTLVKGGTGVGTGVLALTGANTYTGGTTVNNGTLLANNATGSATGTGAVNASGNAVVGGNGAIAGSLNLAATAHLAPGAASGLTGTLTVGALNLGSGTNLDYDINSTSDLDKTIVTQSGGLTINGGTLNINGGATAFTTNGVYNLIGYNGSINGTGVSALGIAAANKNLATNSYTFGTAGGYVTLTIASSGGVVSYWNTDANGTWSAGPWTPSQPNSVGAFASFGGGGTAITADRTITVDSAKTVGTIAFNNAAGKSYTIAGTAPITLDGGAGIPAFVTDSAGNHTISAPLSLVTNGTTFTVTNAADKLTVGGVVSGTGAAITKLGAGTLALTGVNTFDGGTNLSGGTIQINSADSLGATAGNLNFSGGTLQLLADVTSTRTYTTDPNDADAKIDTNGFNLTHNGNITAVVGSNGGLVKSGAGTLTLAGTNTYIGQTTVNAGTLSISSNANLGEQTLGSAVNLNNGATLASTATTGLFNGAAGTNDRNIVVGAGGASIDVADTTSLTVSGTVTGNTLTKINTGTLILTNTGNTVPLVVAAGTLTGGGTTAGTNGGFGSGAITLQGGSTINTLMGANNSLTFANSLTVPTGQTGTLNTPNRFIWSGAVNGGGTLNVGVNTTVSRLDFTNNWAGFTGQLNLTGSGTIRLLNNGGGFNPANLVNASVDVGGAISLQPSNFSGGGTYSLGALSGSVTTAQLANTSQGGTTTWSIGSLGTNTSYAGTIVGNAIVTKVGTGKLTLTGANGYTGLTNINGGTLAINGQFAVGGAVYAGMTLNGGTLQYTSDLATANNGTGDITADSTGVAKPVTLNANGGTFDTNGNDVTFANAIGGTGSLTKAGAGKLTINTLPTYAGATIVKAGTLALSSAASPIVTAGSGYAQIDGGKLTMAYDAGNSPIASIKTQIDASAAIGFTTGQFRSTAITSNRTLGYGDNGADTITVMYTIPGDANLDAKVDFNDFLVLQNNFNQPGTTFAQGNFDFNGITDFNDFLVLQNNFGTSITGAAVSFTSSQVAAIQAFAATVPEPSLLACVGLGATAMLRRRRSH